MPALAEAQRVRHKQPRKRINYALAGTLLGTGMSMAEIAPKVGAKNANVLAVGLCRKGVNQRLAMAPLEAKSVNKSFTLRVANQASELLRDRMSGMLQAHTDKLAEVPAVADVDAIKAVAEALEPLARTAKLVHGWGDESPSGVIMIGETAQAESACGVDATVGSVPIEAEVKQIPQDSQAANTEQPS